MLPTVIFIGIILYALILVFGVWVNGYITGIKVIYTLEQNREKKQNEHNQI